ncbi:hypothetical protein [Methylobacterium sp. J-068]|uniref:hypothetical protein n=1 Tax=Methylobacterium sp. J-068 TaxID=2836649 RepID=UPI001FBAF4BA|nr:hypothetical protein [Methylobacterium sp. J-068]MCJ2035440.1 hypothetical protein [Methylobacterium sp. J-068]
MTKRATSGSPPDQPPEPARFDPFADEAAVRTIGGLSVENGTDRIALHGSIDLTRDAAGLAHARALCATLAAIVTALESEALPETVADATRPGTSVKNPFA